jgi:predicted nucleic acid-binding protein
MNGRVFLDTSVLVYAYDRGSPLERARAWTVIESARFGLVVSPQVMVEFYATVTNSPGGLSERDAEAAIRDLTAAADIVVPKPTWVLDAIATARRDQVPIRDASIIHGALAGRCRRLVTGRLQHGRRFGDLTIENPFHDLH